MNLMKYYARKCFYFIYKENIYQNKNSIKFLPIGYIIFGVQTLIIHVPQYSYGFLTLSFTLEDCWLPHSCCLVSQFNFKLGRSYTDKQTTYLNNIRIGRYHIIVLLILQILLILVNWSPYLNKMRGQEFRPAKIDFQNRTKEFIYISENPTTVILVC